MTRIDMNVFDALKETTGAEYIGELIDAFLGDAPELMEQMRGALLAQDAEAFRRAAHSMKSNAATFGAMELSALARELESFGKERNLEIGGRLAVVEEMLGRVLQQLEALKG